MWSSLRVYKTHQQKPSHSSHFLNHLWAHGVVELLWFIPDKSYGCQANEFMVIQYDITTISIFIKRLDILVIAHMKFSVATKW